MEDQGELDVHVDIPTPDPQPEPVERAEEHIAEDVHNRLSRLETRLDQLVQQPHVRRDELDSRLSGYAPSDHTHDDRYLTLERWENETEPVREEVPRPLEEAQIVAPVDETIADVKEDLRDDMDDDYGRLGLRW